MPNKKQLIILIDPPKLERFKAAAVAIDRSMVWLANDLIDRYLDGDGCKETPTDAATPQNAMEAIAAMGKRLEAIEQRLTAENLTAIIERVLQGWSIKELVKAEMERLGSNLTGPAPEEERDFTNPPPLGELASYWPDGSPLPTGKVSTTPPLNKDELAMLQRLEANPDFRAAAEAAIESGGNSADIAQRLLVAGHGTKKGTAHDSAVITRIKKAIAYLDGGDSL